MSVRSYVYTTHDECIGVFHCPVSLTFCKGCCQFISARHVTVIILLCLHGLVRFLCASFYVLYLLYQ